MGKDEFKVEVQEEQKVVPNHTKVLIFEPRANGHHGPYLHWIATGLAEKGAEVTIVTLPETIEHPSLQPLINCSRVDNARIRVIPFPGSSAYLRPRRNAFGLAARDLACWRMFRRWYKAHFDVVRPDVVLLPFLDYCLYAIGLFGSPFGKCPWVGLTMLPSFHYQEMGVIAPRPSFSTFKKALFFRLLNNPYLRCLLTIDEPLINYLSKRPGKSDVIAFLPQPVEFGILPSSVEAKKRFGLPTQRKLILVYGAITRRKGVIELLRALDDPDFPLAVDVLLAGCIASDISHFLSEPWVQSLLSKGRIFQINRFIMSEEEAYLFAAADIIWLGYRQHYTESGTLVQAACAGRPVLACEEGIIGWQTKRHGLGDVIQIDKVSSIIAGVKDLIDRAPEKINENDRKYSAVVGGTFEAAKNILAKTVIR